MGGASTNKYGDGSNERGKQVVLPKFARVCVCVCVCVCARARARVRILVCVSCVNVLTVERGACWKSNLYLLSQKRKSSQNMMRQVVSLTLSVKCFVAGAFFVGRSETLLYVILSTSEFACQKP